MKKILILSGLSLATSFAFAATEQDFLAKNKSYTDSLIQLLAQEPQSLKSIKDWKSKKSTAESNLKKENKLVADLTKKIASNEKLLVTYNDKLANKAQIEANLTAEKKKNTNKINSLSSQITAKSSSLSFTE